jgi:hypothetical protein
MANRPLFHKGNLAPSHGWGSAVIALLATCTALAQHDKERDKKPDPPVRSAPAERPAPEAKHTAPVEPNDHLARS